MTLTLRGAPADTQLEGALAFFDEAHEHLDRSFLELTPTAMHAGVGGTAMSALADGDAASGLTLTAD